MADDSSPERPDDGEPNPFAGFPMFGDLARALQGQGPLNWDAARQFATLGATDGQAEHNVDPAVRIAYADLARIAGMHVNDVTGSDTAFPEPRIVTRSQWAAETLEAYRPLFTDLATSLGQQPDETNADTSDPMLQMMAGISKMMQPAMMGMSVGSMVGALSKRVFGLHDLPIPRGRQEVVLVARTIDDFAGQWEIPIDQMRLWVLAHELSGYQVFAIDHLRETLTSLVRSYAGGFRPDPSSLADQLGGLDPLGGGDDPLQALQQAFSDPEVLLGAVQSPEQRAMQPRLDAAVAAVVGYTDWVVDAVAVRVIGGEALRVAEAVRRQRVERTPDDVFVEKLLGIRVGDDQVARGKSFVQGVVDRVGEHGLTRLLRMPDSLPTANELDAPGLWIARVSGE
ncbi:MAG TPA: zinc-dependent metalloprotease [Ilumatobacter sp.]|nr:zinc-dependent metalloprotease [Ilumatobacter sp.]